MDRTEAARRLDLADLPDSYFHDPSDHFRLLRDHDPIHRNGDGSILLTRHEDVGIVWRDLTATVMKEELFRSRWGDGPLLECHTTHMLFRDPPDHDRLRTILNPFFKQKAIERLAAPVSAIVDRLLDELAERRQADFVSDFAFPLPTEVICAMIGLPYEDRHYLRDLGESVVNSLNPALTADEIATAHRKADEFKRYLKAHVERTRLQATVDPSLNLLGALVSTEKDGREISENEIIHTCILMFIGGHGTTMNMLSSTLHLLLENPDQLADLRDNPDIVETALDELFRFITPIQLQGRRTTRDVALPSGDLPRGTEVVLCPGAANRDDRVFEAPDTLALRRKPNNHIAFGAGIHFCLGRPLAKLVMRTVFPRILDRFRSIERTGPAIYRKLPRFRSLSQLPLRLS